MRKRNQRLVILFFGLLLVNLSLLLFDGKSSSLSFEEKLFVVNDTSGVTSITFTQPDQRIEIARSPQGWLLDGSYKVDDRLRRLFLSIMQRVVVKKPVSIEVPSEHITVNISADNPMSIEVWGNGMKTKTFFSMTGSQEVYEVGIPGYNEFLGGIFYLNSDQWRDRLVVDASWRTIQELKLDYLNPEEEDLNIKFSDTFFSVEGVSALDSNAVVNYLNQFQYFEANERISSGRFLRYDSLSKMPPLATLRMLTIDHQDPIILDVYQKLSGEQYFLVADMDHSLMMIDERRILNILKNPSDLKSGD